MAAAGAAAAPQVPLSHAGRWITDATGRVVVLHGVNMVEKRAPYAPGDAGFGADDARFLRDEGFNTVRLGVIYKALEPTRSHFDDAYLQKIAQTADLLEREGIFPLIDFHQDMYNERFQGEGFPDWAVIDDGLPNQPAFGFPGNYLAMPALERAFDHFWANDDGLQDSYAAAWQHVADALRPDPFLLGFDIFNEPWPGSQWPTCAQPEGCPVWDSGPLTDFTKRTFKAIRAADDGRLLFYEEHPIFNDGTEEYHGDTGDERAGMSFHIYCLATTPGVAEPPGDQPAKDAGCPVGEQRVFDAAERQSAKTGDALILSEFGATDNVADIKRVADQADANRMSWQYWTYWNDSATQSVIKNLAKPPTPDNVAQDKLAVLVRPYPSATAGTPLAWSFDAASKTFSFKYTTARADGKGAFGAGSETDVTVPARVYPNGYDVAVDGAALASPPGAAVLVLRSLPAAQRVSVKVTPHVGTRGGAVLGVKKPDIGLTVSPARVHSGRLVRFAFRAFALTDGKRQAATGVLVTFARRRARTDGHGIAHIAARLAPGRHVAEASRRGYASGRAAVRALRRSA